MAVISEAIPHHNYSLIENIIYVIDGVPLIQRLTWGKGLTYKAIYVKYVNYVKRTLGPKSLQLSVSRI